MTTEFWYWTTMVFVFALGTRFGAWARDLQWRDKGDQGYPRMLSGGHFYWVSREDVDCAKCYVHKPIDPKTCDHGWVEAPYGHYCLYCGTIKA